jgi:hypothetical protein
MAQSQHIHRQLLIALVAIAFVAIPGPAVQAQEADATAERKVDGLGSGKVRFHPALTLSGGYDTNVFYEDTNETPDGAAVIGVRPEIGITTHKPTNVDFRLKGGVYFQYFVSDDPLITEQSGLEANAAAGITFNPNGAVAFKLSDTFVRTNETPSGSSLLSFNRIYNNAGATLIIQPGGKILTGELGGRAAITRNQQLVELDKNEFGVRAQLKWKFLPKTALIADASWDFIFYEVKERMIPGLEEGEEPQFLSPFQGAFENIDSRPLRAKAGLKGLLFNRISVTLLGGYGQGFYAGGDDFKGFIANAELAYEIGPTSRFQLGYIRDFRDNTFSNYAKDHNIYSRYNHQFGGRFDLKLEGAFIYREFSPIPAVFLPDVTVDGVRGAQAFSTTERVDPLVTGDVDGTFYITEIFTVGLNYNLAVNTSDFVQITGQGATGSATAQFVKHRVFLTTGVRW